MTKRFIIVLIVSFAALWARAQGIAKDSLNLDRLLKVKEEPELNPEAIRQIDLGSGVGTPRISEEKNWMLPDETLPMALPKKKVILTLRPYTANTRYDWDPVYQRKVRIDRDTWRADPLEKLYKYLFPTNKARTPMDGGIRRSWQDIRDSGIDFRTLCERANGMMVSTTHMGGIPIGRSGVSVSGGCISGLDLMAVFTKDFWDRKGRERRARTLDVLRTYGDSTTVLINHPVEPIAR